MDTDFSDGEVVLLHSRGGNLAGGVALGKLIREYNLSTEVGGGPPVSQDEIWEWPDAGVCESACAYAFLGGGGGVNLVRVISWASIGFIRDHKT